MRRRFPSDSYASEKARRLRRIARRSSAELTRAFENAQLSLRQYDLLSRRPARQQKHIIAAERARSAAALIAAETVNRFLDNLEAKTPIRLSEVSAAISSAIWG
jgi:hypothetical protein